MLLQGGLELKQTHVHLLRNTWTLKSQKSLRTKEPLCVRIRNGSGPDEITLYINSDPFFKGWWIESFHSTSCRTDPVPISTPTLLSSIRDEEYFCSQYIQWTQLVLAFFFHLATKIKFSLIVWNGFSSGQAYTNLIGLNRFIRVDHVGQVGLTCIKCGLQ